MLVSPLTVGTEIPVPLGWSLHPLGSAPLGPLVDPVYCMNIVYLWVKNRAGWEEWNSGKLLGLEEACRVGGPQGKVVLRTAAALSTVLSPSARRVGPIPYAPVSAPSCY